MALQCPVVPVGGDARHIGLNLQQGLFPTKKEAMK